MANLDRQTDLGPLKPLVLEILLVLTDGELHGYGLVKEIERRTQGGMKIEPANLYRTLRTVTEQGLIEESDRRPDPALDDQRRRYFRITDLGLEAARSEVQRLERVLALAKASRLAVR